MKFSELLRGLQTQPTGGDPLISGLHYDSRRIQPSWAFVAWKGESTDGNRYIDAALKNGATAVVTDSATEQPRAGVAWALVSPGRKALAQTSGNFYGHPAAKLKIIGVTGTNG